MVDIIRPGHKLVRQHRTVKNFGGNKVWQIGSQDMKKHWRIEHLHGRKLRINKQVGGENIGGLSIYMEGN